MQLADFLYQPAEVKCPAEWVRRGHEHLPLQHSAPVKLLQASSKPRILCNHSSFLGLAMLFNFRLLLIFLKFIFIHVKFTKLIKSFVELTTVYESRLNNSYTLNWSCSQYLKTSHLIRYFIYVLLLYCSEI